MVCAAAAKEDAKIAARGPASNALGGKNSPIFKIIAQKAIQLAAKDASL
ncbi:hypothetical protein amb0784 [Paramagnetospirillum magneticum AMB-1]|uniref:Uncharacterized protein n=1 Tax=Paramagnetospirillum magneticum (strain ATCC 700264 / AMB-1) TaxID=342108 RepID=Q2W987_PARM1|nr:hypothetical protein amb0784 [Paramagnetospirillum magneticum AMB-1]